MTYVAMRNVEQMGECRLAHKRGPSGDAGRVGSRGHPQLLLVRLVEKEGAEPLAGSREIEQVFEIQVIVYLVADPRVNIYFAC